MRKIIYLLLLSGICLYAQKSPLLYKNFLDYYSEHAKTTILGQDLKALKDGAYDFKGSRQDFNFLLRVLKIDDKDLTGYDTLYLSGTVKGLVKVGQWDLKFKNPKTGVLENILNQTSVKIPDAKDRIESLNYGVSGRKHFLFRKKATTADRVLQWDDKLVYNFRYTDSRPDKNSFIEEEHMTIFKKSRVISYKRNAELQCPQGGYILLLYQESKDLSKQLKTEITFENNKSTTTQSGDAVSSQKFNNQYGLKITEDFKDEILVSISFEFSEHDKGKDYFGKWLDTNNYLNILYKDDAGCLTKD